MRNTLMDWFGLSVPILQAPIGGSDTPALATAVSRAGGMGSLAMTWNERDQGLTRVAELNAAGASYFLNFVVQFGTERIAWYLDRGVPAITLSWGIDACAIAAIKAAGIRAGVQVGSAEGASRAITSGADFIIAQGIEAGGHVQSSTPLRTLLSEVLPLAGATPVVAAGGIASGDGIAAALRMGAQAVMMGTRFVAAAESSAHADYKAALVAATASDTVYTNCFDGDWPYAMHRVLRNSTFRAWEAAGCPMPPHRPGEGDIIMRSATTDFARYNIEQPSDAVEGDTEAACLYAGTGIDHIDAVRPAGEIVSRLWKEAEALL